MKEKKQVVLSLGSNIENRQKYLEDAIQEIEKAFDCEVKKSRFYETAPWGFESEVPFLNCCVCFYSSCNPIEVLIVTKKIENKLGRVKKSQINNYESRVIDVDILYVGDEVVKTPELTIPHPLLYARSFVLTPLVEILPGLIDPVKKQTILQLFEQCNDDNRVILYEK